jgi:hypothetical protein
MNQNDFKTTLCSIYVFCIFCYSHAADWSNNKNAEVWNLRAKDTLNQQLKQKPNRNLAKNVILFLGTRFFCFV